MSFGKIVFLAGKCFFGRGSGCAGGKKAFARGESFYCREAAVFLEKWFSCRESGFAGKGNGSSGMKRVYR